MSSGRDDRIAPTARYTAHVWHRLGLPHAELFRTRRGFLLFWGFRVLVEWLAVLSPRIPSMSQALDMRHRTIDAALDRFRPDLVVEIGAGLGRRGLTWAHDRGIPYWEVDLPAVVAEKRRLLRTRAPELLEQVQGRLQWSARNALDADFPDWLGSLVDSPRRVAIVAEGLLLYLSAEQTRALLAGIRRALAPAAEGLVLCDVLQRRAGVRGAAVRRVARAAIRLATRGHGARQEFDGTDEARAFFHAAGFTNAAPLPPNAVPKIAHLPFPAQVWELRP